MFSNLHPKNQQNPQQKRAFLIHFPSRLLVYLPIDTKCVEGQNDRSKIRRNHLQTACPHTAESFLTALIRVNL
jgi:hypothetical protein